MHEMAIMAGMLGIIQEEARAKGFRRVRKVGMAVGRFSGVEPDALRFAFDVTVAGSAAEGAELELEAADGLAQCRSCGGEFPATSYTLLCPACLRPDLRLVGGRDVRVAFLDVD